MIKKILLYYFMILVIYVIFINFVFYIFSININIQDSNITSNNEKAEQHIGASFDVDILVTHNKMYGKIIEDNNSSKLYLFNIIPIPLLINNFNFDFIHTTFVILFLSSFLGIYTYERRKNAQTT